MSITTFALFESYSKANDAVIALGNVGYAKDDISVVAHEDTVKDHEGSDTAAGAGAGATLGGIAGLIVGIASTTVPGVGPIIGSGIIATILSSTAIGAGAGAAMGGILGMLTDMGASKEAAEKYETAIKEGHVLVAVTTTRERLPEVEDILSNYGGQDIHVQAEENTRVKAR